MPPCLALLPDLLFVAEQTLLIFLALIPLQIWRAGRESKVLEEKFGGEYRNYRAQSRVMLSGARVQRSGTRAESKHPYP